MQTTPQQAFPFNRLSVADKIKDARPAFRQGSDFAYAATRERADQAGLAATERFRVDAPSTAIIMPRRRAAFLSGPSVAFDFFARRHGRLFSYFSRIAF